MAFSPPLVLDHQLPSRLKHDLQSWMCKGGDVDGPNVDDEQITLDGVFLLYAGNLPQPHSFFGRIRNMKKIES